MNELSGHITLVTGGSRGIGLAVSQELARAGCTVAVIGRNEESGQRSSGGLKGEGHRAYGCDVSDYESAASAADQVTKDLGPVDILVNNAGITRDNLFIRMKEEEWDDVLAVNLKGAFNMTKALARGMMKRRSGVILNVTSVVGLIGTPVRRTTRRPRPASSASPRASPRSWRPEGCGAMPSHRVSSTRT